MSTIERLEDLSSGLQTALLGVAENSRYGLTVDNFYTLEAMGLIVYHDQANNHLTVRGRLLVNDYQQRQQAPETPASEPPVKHEVMPGDYPLDLRPIVAQQQAWLKESEAQLAAAQQRIAETEAELCAAYWYLDRIIGTFENYPLHGGWQRMELDVPAIKSLLHTWQDDIGDILESEKLLAMPRPAPELKGEKS